MVRACIASAHVRFRGLDHISLFYQFIASAIVDGLYNETSAEYGDVVSINSRVEEGCVGD